MTSNILKLVACLSMLIDHVGYLLFPSLEWMRWIGRLAMPIFAFFIAEGCRYTSNKLRYFLRIFGLGLLCQAVYAAEEFLNGQISSIYLNILFTFSLSAIMCFAFLKFRKSFDCKEKSKIFASGALFVCTVFSVWAFDIFCTHSYTLTGIDITFDYGFAGAALPLFAVMFSERRHKWMCYSLGVILFVLSFVESMWYFCFALFDIILLYFYNGKRGKYSTKYLFYIFYPLHLVAIYGISLLMN